MTHQNPDEKDRILTLFGIECNMDPPWATASDEIVWYGERWHGLSYIQQVKVIKKYDFTFEVTMNVNPDIPGQEDYTWLSGYGSTFTEAVGDLKSKVKVHLEMVRRDLATIEKILDLS